jgi:hypothetical protein
MLAVPITFNSGIELSEAMMSSVMPSQKYCCPGSELRFENGSTATVRGFGGFTKAVRSALDCAGTGNDGEIRANSAT